MNNHKRRSFRPRQQKNNFRRRSNNQSKNVNGQFINNGNVNVGRNGSMNNPFNLEKAIQKFQQLAKDAQSNGDPILFENFLQHADHYTRRLKEIRSREKNDSLSNNLSEKDTNQDSNL